VDVECKMSSEKPLIAVAGATGMQGGSVVKFLLEDGGFCVRAITRNVDSPKAKELSAKGVEVVKADFNDVVSVTEAFQGAYGVFGVTNFWEVMSGEKETEQGKTLVDAAKAAGVKHFVWSTLDLTKNPSCDHWDSKYRVDEYLKAGGVPRTSLYTSFYFENFYFFPFIAFKKEEDGTLLADWPYMASDGPIGAYAAGETGAYVVEALKNPGKWINSDLRVMNEIFTPRQFVTIFAEESGKKVELKEIDMQTFEATKDIPGVGELWANNKWFYVNNGDPGRDVKLTKSIYPKAQSARDFIKANLDKLIPK